MPALIGFVLGLVAVIAYAVTRKGDSSDIPSTQPTQNEAPPAAPVIVESIYQQIGNIRGVDPDLLKAIAMAESNENDSAVRWNPPSDVSVGRMQILCVPPSGADQSTDFVCQNKLDLADQWPQTFYSLRDAQTNVDIAAQLLAYNLRTYGFPRGVAVYNNFGARLAPVNGPFPNQKYVDRVLSNLNAIKGA